MANLEGLLCQVEACPLALLHWGASMCSGFVVLNFRRMDVIWTLARRALRQTPPRKGKGGKHLNDQLILIAVNETFPQEIHLLEYGWDMAVTNRFCPAGDAEFVATYPNVDMLYFNGNRNDASYFGSNTSWINQERHRGGWGNTRYYVTLPWAWTRHQARALARPGAGDHGSHLEFWSESWQRGRGVRSPPNSRANREANEKTKAAKRGRGSGSQLGGAR